MSTKIVNIEALTTLAQYQKVYIDNKVDEIQETIPGLYIGSIIVDPDPSYKLPGVEPTITEDESGNSILNLRFYGLKGESASITDFKVMTKDDGTQLFYSIFNDEEYDTSNTVTIPELINMINAISATVENKAMVWHGTEEEYDQVTWKDPNTIYIID